MRERKVIDQSIWPSAVAVMGIPAGNFFFFFCLIAVFGTYYCIISVVGLKLDAGNYVARGVFVVVRTYVSVFRSPFIFVLGTLFCH